MALNYGLNAFEKLDGSIAKCTVSMKQQQHAGARIQEANTRPEHKAGSR